MVMSPFKVSDSYAHSGGLRSDIFASIKPQVQDYEIKYNNNINACETNAISGRHVSTAEQHSSTV